GHETQYWMDRADKLPEPPCSPEELFFAIEDVSGYEADNLLMDNPFIATIIQEEMAAIENAEEPEDIQDEELRNIIFGNPNFGHGKYHDVISGVEEFIGRQYGSLQEYMELNPYILKILSDGYKIPAYLEKQKQQ